MSSNGRTIKDPALPFYFRDYLSSGRVQRMSWAEKAVYLHLLFRSWESGGWLANDDESLADALGVTVEEVPTLVTPTVRRCFIERDGKIANERLLREAEQRHAYLASQAEAGRAGAAARWGSGGTGVPDEKSTDGDPIATPKARHVSPMANDASHPIPSHPIPNEKDPPASLGPPSAGSNFQPAPVENSEPAKRGRPRRRRWRIETGEDGVPDVVGVDDADLELDRERGPDVDAPAFRRCRFAPRILELAADGKAPKDLRRAFYRVADPKRREEGGWLVREQAAAAEGRSAFPLGGVVADSAAGVDPRTANRITIDPWGDWPINAAGFDEDRDGGSWFDVARTEAKTSERFYLTSSGWIASVGAGAGGTGLRKATLDEVFGLFAGPERDPDVANRWRTQLGFAGVRGAALARSYATKIRAQRSRDIGRLVRNGSTAGPSAVGDVLGDAIDEGGSR